MPRVSLAAPTDQESLRNRARLVDLGLRDGRPAAAAGRLRDERQRHHGREREVVARLRVVDVEELPEAPVGRELRQGGLDVHPCVAGAHGQRVGHCRRHSGLECAVHEETPDLLERHPPDQVLDVHPAVAERAALLVGLGDLGPERDDSLEPRRDLNDVRHARLLT